MDESRMIRYLRKTGQALTEDQIRQALARSGEDPKVKALLELLIAEWQQWSDAAGFPGEAAQRERLCGGAAALINVINRALEHIGP